MNVNHPSTSPSNTIQRQKPLHATSSEYAAVDELCHILARVIMRLHGAQEPEVIVNDGGVQ